MAIRIDRQLNRGLTELVSDISDVLPMGQKQACKCMQKELRMNLPESSLAEVRRKSSSNIALLEGRSLLLAAWPGALCAFLLLTALVPISANGQSFTSPMCLIKSPVDIEECFEEFLASDIEDNAQWFMFLNLIKPRIYYNQETKAFRIHSEKPAEQPFKYQPRLGVSDESERTLLHRELRRNVEVPYLSSGGLINILTLKPSLDGHSDVTKRILARTFKFNYQAQLVAADASQDPDFYAWPEDAAHAQTPADTNGKVAEGDIGHGEEGIKAFGKWLSDRIKAIKRHCERDESLYALYMLGYSLHGVQDLAAHNGRTMVEHSWDSYCKNPECDDSKPAALKDGDPDEEEDNIDLAHTYSLRFLSDVRSVIGESCWTKMKLYDGNNLSSAEKRSIFGLRWTLWPSDFKKYKQARFSFAKSPKGPEYVVRWISEPDRRIERVFRSLWGTLGD